MRQVVKEWCATAFERLEIHGCIVQCAILPTPREDADPFEGQGAHGGLMRLGLVALRLGRALSPAGRPRGCRRPCHAGLAEELRAWEAAGDPRLRAAACCAGCHTGVPLACRGRRRAGALCTTGDEPPGGEDGPRAREGLEAGAIRRTLGPRRDGVGQGRDRRSGHAQRAAVRVGQRLRTSHKRPRACARAGRMPVARSRQPGGIHLL